MGLAKLPEERGPPGQFSWFCWSGCDHMTQLLNISHGVIDIKIKIEPQIHKPLVDFIGGVRFLLVGIQTTFE